MFFFLSTAFFKRLEKILSWMMVCWEIMQVTLRNFFLSGDKNLVGSEVKIYSLDPSTQWFSATIVNGNPASKTLQVNCEEVKDDANCM